MSVGSLASKMSGVHYVSQLITILFNIYDISIYTYIYKAILQLRYICAHVYLSIYATSLQCS